VGDDLHLKLHPERQRRYFIEEVDESGIGSRADLRGRREVYIDLHIFLRSQDLKLRDLHRDQLLRLSGYGDGGDPEDRLVARVRQG